MLPVDSRNIDGIDLCYMGTPQVTLRAKGEENHMLCPKRCAFNPRSNKIAKPKHARKGTPEQSLVESIRASEKRILEEDSAHTFEVGFDNISHSRENSVRSSQVTLEPSSYTDEKYRLFDTYQTSIHKDISSSHGFNQFLVESPLTVSSLYLR